MSNHPRVLLALAFLLANVAAFAQDATPQARQLQPVTVTATRTSSPTFDVPASVDVIDSDRIHGAGHAEINLSESVGLVPGLTARDRQNYAQDLQLSIRGFGARSTFGVRGVRVYVDGIPATMPDGQGQLSHIDLATAGRIEVLRGPFSVLYGNSSGGVVQVFTAPGEGPPSANASVAAGSDGIVRSALRAQGASGALRYAVGANTFHTDGSRDHSAADRDLLNARFDIGHGAASEWTLVANSVRIGADDPLGLTRAQFDAAPRSADAAALQFNTRKTVQQTQAGLVHERHVDAANTLHLMLYGGQRDTVQFQAIPTAPQANALHPGGVIGLARRYAGADARWTWKPDAELSVVTGLDLDTLAEHRQGWQNFIGTSLGVEGALRRDEDNRVSNVDPYVQAVWHFAPRWTLTAGVRHSSVRFASRDQFVSGINGNDSGGVRYAATLPVAALMFALSPNVHLYAAAGRGFETPTFNELAYRPDGTSGLNFALRPSRSNNIEAGAKGRSWTFALFETNTADELVTQTNTGGRSTFQNAGATRRRGAEASWSQPFAGDGRVQLAQTWLDARYRDAFRTCVSTPCGTPTVVIPAGNRIPGVAQSVSAAEVAWQPAHGWQAAAEWRRSSRVFVNDANSESAPSYSTMAISTGYVFDVQRWKLAASARIDNLFDHAYAGSVIVNEGNGRFYEPAPGRSWTIKLAGTYAF